jgi:DNA mismatch endonuclease (patch repair protein)
VSAPASLLAQTTGESRTEAALRRAVRAAGALGYRKGYRLRPVPGLGRRSADMAWPGRRLAVFADGCFWHGCSVHHDARYGVNDAYWRAKIARNAARDAETTGALLAAGWTVVRVWEHEDLGQAVARVLEALRGV